MSNMARKALRWGGDRLVYVGEGDGGCNASDAFFIELARAWTLTTEVEIPQWYGIHDYLQVYERNTNAS